MPSPLPRLHIESWGEVKVRPRVTLIPYAAATSSSSPGPGNRFTRSVTGTSAPYPALLPCTDVSPQGSQCRSSPGPGSGPRQGVRLRAAGFPVCLRGCRARGVQPLQPPHTNTPPAPPVRDLAGAARLHAGHGGGRGTAGSPRAGSAAGRARTPPHTPAGCPGLTVQAPAAPLEPHRGRSAPDFPSRLGCGRGSRSRGGTPTGGPRPAPLVPGGATTRQTSETAALAFASSLNFYIPKLVPTPDSYEVPDLIPTSIFDNSFYQIIARRIV